MRTPLKAQRGLGAAKEGAHGFWLQRLTAVALVPLVLWFVYAMVKIAGAPYLVAADYMAEPHHAVFMLLLIWAGMVHLRIGLNEVIEDYVPDHAMNVACKILNTFFVVTMGVTCAYAILKISFGA
jgi:succinate dehydrogenase / fumarate reductase membrane anchor subunit